MNFARHASRNFRKLYICQHEPEERAKMAVLDGHMTQHVELKKVRNAERTADMFRYLTISEALPITKDSHPSKFWQIGLTQ